MRPLVSVIVPVYKVEKYLGRCLDSLSRQSLKNIEILLIDDASPDRCGEICERYAAKDRRYKVIHNKVNRGVSAVRNFGVANAAGEYLMFVDSDDWVHEDFCKEAYECAVHNRADLVMFGYQQILMDDKTNLNGAVSFIARAGDGFKTREEAMDLELTAFSLVPWNRLYHKSLFKDIYYPEGQVFEDTATTYKIIWKASRIYCIDKVLYCYYRHLGSITMQNVSKELFRTKYKVYRQMCYDLSAWGFSSERFEQCKNKYAITYCIQTPLDFSDPCYVFFADVLRHMKKVPQDFTRQQKLMVKVFQQSPQLFNLLCSLCNKHIL